MTADDITDLRVAHKIYLEQQLSAVESYKPRVPLLKNQWSGMVWPASKEANMFPDTGVDEDTLVNVGKASVTLPVDGFVRAMTIILYFLSDINITGDPPSIEETRQESIGQS